jgi:hypothetical protein
MRLLDEISCDEPGAIYSDVSGNVMQRYLRLNAMCERLGCGDFVTNAQLGG